MKKLLLVAVALLGAVLAYEQSPRQHEVDSTAEFPSPESIQRFDRQQSGQQVTGSGTVTRVLSDDNEGSRHQRFVLELSSGQTVLVAHNIDLAPRLSSLKSGDTVMFNGEFEWNEQGGVIHWTHKDPRRSHTDGWLEHNGHRYE